MRSETRDQWRASCLSWHGLSPAPGRAEAPSQAQVEALQAQVPYRLAPLLLQAEADGKTELPLGGFERPRSPVDHRSYAITWFSMAAVALGTWVGLGVKQGRDRALQELRVVRPPGRVA